MRAHDRTMHLFQQGLDYWTCRFTWCSGSLLTQSFHRCLSALSAAAWPRNISSSLIGWARLTSVPDVPTHTSINNQPKHKRHFRRTTSAFKTCEALFIWALNNACHNTEPCLGIFFTATLIIGLYTRLVWFVYIYIYIYTRGGHRLIFLI